MSLSCDTPLGPIGGLRDDRGRPVARSRSQRRWLDIALIAGAFGFVAVILFVGAPTGAVADSTAISIGSVN